MRLQGDVEHTYKGAAKHIGVVLEDRAGGRKHITRITAMEAFAIDPDELATALQRRFQANARCVACVRDQSHLMATIYRHCRHS